MRKPLVVGALLSFAVLLCAGAAQAALSAYLVQRIKDSVVLVDVALSLAGGDKSEGSGSGFVISPDGLIVTNYHVVSMQAEAPDGGTTQAQSRDVKVIFHSGTDREKIYAGKVLRENPDLDLALIKVEIATPVFLELADSEAVAETSAVYACGHPLGLREISIRSGTVTAKRTWEGHRYLEHDAMAEGGNSGGPVVDADGRVLGIHTLTLTASNSMTKFAIPSNVLRDWLKTDPANDPKPQVPGKRIKDLLDAADLKYDEKDGGVFELPYDNDVTVTVHQYEQFLRAYVPLGVLPGANEQEQGRHALEALRFNYTEPVGRLSLFNNKEEKKLELYWECQIPFSVAAQSPAYVKAITLAGANQAERWAKIAAGEEPEEPNDLYPGGDEKQQLAELKRALEGSGLKFEEKGEDDNLYYALPYDNDVTVNISIIKGMVWTHCWVGGMPGGDEAGKGRKAIELLLRNWDDPFGRLSLDGDGDVLWESQVPHNFLTPDYLAILANSCDGEVAAYKKAYGEVPLNG